MPNWVTNHLTIEAENEERLHEIMTAIAYDDKGLGTIDFEKIIPMPENIFRGNLGDEERQLYGKNNWYDFGIAHWGTKWNSAPKDDPHKYAGGNRLEFQTAWDPPEPVIVRLSEMFPDAQFRHVWADEDIGVNVGEITYQKGEAVEYDVPNGGSKEAYEMASEIIGVELSEYELYYSKTKGNYTLRDNLEWEDMEANGNVHIGADFCSLLIDEFPTYLYYDTAIGVAWLELNEGTVDSYHEDGQDDTVEHCQQLCKEWGVRVCDSMEDYDALLDELGARFCDDFSEDESEDFGMGGLTL
jgi:hypothetical protein